MFYIFPRIVDKVTCERLTKELLKETKFQEALVINQGESDIYDKPGDEERDRQDHNTRKTDIKFLSDKRQIISQNNFKMSKNYKLKERDKQILDSLNPDF